MVQPHEIKIIHVNNDEDDSSSIASFEQLPHRTPLRGGDAPKEKLLVDGKVPDVLHVLNYLGSCDRLIQCRQSTQAFKKVPRIDADLDGFADDEVNADKPILEIVTAIYTTRTRNRSRRGRRLSPPQYMERPLTEAFEPPRPNCAYYSDDEEDYEACTPEISHPIMVIHSEYLINALKAVVAYYPHINLDGKSVTITSPYRVLYHHRAELEKYQSNQPEAHSPEYAATTAYHTQTLLKFLKENLGSELRREEERHQLDTPMATFEYFWLLLKPGEVIYAKRYDIWTPFVISSVHVNPHAYNACDVYKVNCWMLETNSVKIHRFMYSFTVSPWLGEQAISSLSVIPASFWPEDLGSQNGKSMREYNIELGKLYWELLKRPTYMEYDGLLVNSGSDNTHARGPTGFMRGRVVCDAAGFDMFKNRGPERCFLPPPLPRGERGNQAAPPIKDHLPKNGPRCGCNACTQHRPDQSDSPYSGFEEVDPLHDEAPENELFYLVCGKTIPGFILNDRRWGHLNVANLRAFKPDREAFKYLVLDDEIKTTVKALIGKFATDLGEGKISPWGNDFVKNKGEGRIFLLHGSPGVGKTCTAECVAELANRPLISLTSGDLSVRRNDVEDNLSYFLKLGQRYGALVLLDEADVYLERRRAKDISRNGLVSVFLRALEYYRGVLFLTTNRVRSFDGAFLSRIHVALHYHNLRDEDRERIWAANFDRLGRDSHGRIHVSNAAKDFAWSSAEIRSLKWNGREIRNAMQTALALAESEAQEENTERITMQEKHLRAVVKMSRSFKDYMKGSSAMADYDDGYYDSSDDSLLCERV